MKAFPEASVIRMDSDTTTRKGSHFRLLNTFREGKADILVGTQMIAKGLAGSLCDRGRRAAELSRVL